MKWPRTTQSAYAAIVADETRTPEQNKLMWALLGEIAEHFDSRHAWKDFFLRRLGHAHSSTLTVEQFTMLIELIVSWGMRNGVQFRHLEAQDDQAQEDRGEDRR